jgi:hypothetical protein
LRRLPWFTRLVWSAVSLPALNHGKRRKHHIGQCSPL